MSNWPTVPTAKLLCAMECWCKTLKSLFCDVSPFNPSILLTFNPPTFNPSTLQSFHPPILQPSTFHPSTLQPSTLPPFNPSILQPFNPSILQPSTLQSYNPFYVPSVFTNQIFPLVIKSQMSLV